MIAGFRYPVAPALEGVQAKARVIGKGFDGLGGTAAEAVLEEYGLAGGVGFVEMGSHGWGFACREKGTSSALRAASPEEKRPGVRPRSIFRH